MRVVFMGTPEFAVPILRALAEHHHVAAVYTRPDAASGRGAGLRASAVKVAAESLGLFVEQPATLRSDAASSTLASFAPDALVVAAYGLILPREVLEIPQLGAINVHASLLPRWRGAAPIQRAILAGDEVTGVSVMRMEEGLDTGPYCETAVTAIEEKTATELTAELAGLGAAALLRALRRLETGACEWVEQDAVFATYAAKVTKSDVRLAPDLTAEEFVRRVRASTRQAPARLLVRDAGVTVLGANSIAESLDPGRVATVGAKVLFGASDGAVSVTEVKPEGRRAMDASAWARGASIGPATQWGAAS